MKQVQKQMKRKMKPKMKMMPKTKIMPKMNLKENMEVASRVKYGKSSVVTDLTFDIGLTGE